MVTWSFSADVPPALNATFTGIGVGSDRPSKSCSWGCQVRTVTSSFGCFASGLAWVRIVGGVIRRAGQVLRVYRDEVPERHGPEELRVSGAEVGAGVDLALGGVRCRARTPVPCGPTGR